MPRRVLILILVLAAVCVWLLWPRPGSVHPGLLRAHRGLTAPTDGSGISGRGSRDDATGPAHAPGLVGAPPSGEPPAAPDGRSAPALGNPLPAATGGITCTLRIDLAQRHAWPPQGGVVYVLPAGQDGARRLEQVTHQKVSADDDHVDLPVAAAGPWDVFCLYGTGRLQALDVVAGAPLHEVVPGVAGCGIVVFDAGDAAAAGQELRVSLQRAGEVEGLAAPGRRDPLDVHLHMTLEAPGRVMSPPLPLSTVWQVRVRTQPPAATGAEAGWRRWAAVPAQVRTGGTVHLRREPYGVLRAHVHWAEPPPADWTASSARLVVMLEVFQPDIQADLHAGGGAAWLETATREAVQAGTDVLFAVPAGRVRLDVTSIGMQPLSSRDLDIVAGETLDVDVPITARAAGTFVRDGHVWREAPPGAEVVVLPVHVLGPGGSAAPVRAHLVALDPDDPGNVLCSDVDPSEDDGLHLDQRWLRARGVVARSGADLVSRAQRVRADAEPTFELLRGGFVVVVPVIWPDPRLGPLRLRRADGLPIEHGSYQDGGLDAPVREREALVVPGTVIGPLPPGEMRFQAWLGSLRLPDLTVHIASGCVVPLPVGG